jgi:hypothetical protein
MNACTVIHIEYASFSGWLYFTLALQALQALGPHPETRMPVLEPAGGSRRHFGFRVGDRCRIASASDPILQPTSQSALI